MRKLYLLFSLALLLVGVNTVSAKLVLGNQKTTFADGDKVFFQGCNNINKGTEWAFGSWLYAQSGASITESVWFARGGTEALPGEHNGYLFELQDAGTSFEKNGKTYQGFHLYSPGLGKYAVSTGSNYFFKKNKERAQVFYLIPPADYAAIMGRESFATDYPGIQEVLKTAFNLIVRIPTNNEGDLGNGKDGFNYYGLNRATSNGRLSNMTYVDWGIWLYVFEGSDVDDIAGSLTDLIQTVTPVVNNGIAGTLPGCVANAEAFETLKTAYATATAVDVDAATVYPVLKEAYDKFRTFGKGGFVPLTDGYWRIRSAYSGFFEKQSVYKAVYPSGTNGLVWGNEDLENKSQIFKVTATDDSTRFVIQNVISLRYCDRHTTNVDSTTIKVKRSSYCLPEFTLGNGGTPWHVQSHSSGDGKSGNVIEYGGEGRSSQCMWSFVPVENFTAEELTAGMEQLIRNDEYADLLATAMTLYRKALDFLPYSKENNNIITYTPAEGEEANKTEYGDAGIWKGGTVKSNAKQNSEGSYGALCDGVNVAGSFFHSSWGNGSSSPSWHHLQFDLDEPIENVAFYWAPRLNEGTPRRISKIDVQVCNDTTGGGVWATVASLKTDYVMSGDEWEVDGKTVVGNDEVLTGAVSLFGSYKHIRMVAKEVMSRTKNNETGLNQYTANSGMFNGYPFFTAGELNILKVEGNPDCQMAALKGNAEIAPFITALEAEFTKSANIAEPTAEDMEALQKAYDDFVSVFPDSEPLLKKIADTQSYISNMYVGGVPGTYESQDDLDEKKLAVQNAIDMAQADIDEQTLYTKQQVEDHIAAIEAARQALSDGARPVDFTKWVRLYITREYWTQNPDILPPSDWVMNSAMYAPETAESEVSEIPFDVFDKSNEKAFDWRFIPVTGGYFIQSRSTGKFIGESRSYESSHAWYPALSSVPAVFTVEPIGGGSFVIAGTNLDGSGVTVKAGFGEAYKYLHGAVAGQALAYWESRNLGSRSGWEFEIQSEDAFTEDANADMQNNAFMAKKLVGNKLYTGCYPTEVSLMADGDGELKVYTVAGKNADESVIYLQAMEDTDGMFTIEAGTPFLYEVGEPGSDFTQYVQTEGEEAAYTVIVYYEIYPTLDAEENDKLYVATPTETAGIVGLFSDERVFKGHGLVSVYEKSNAVVPYFYNQIEEDDEVIRTVLRRAEAYIDPASAEVLSVDEATGCLELPVAGKVDNAIDQVTGTGVAGTFDVYTIDGIRVRTGVDKANALKGLKSGLYIINKQKVVVE